MLLVMVTNIISLTLAATTLFIATEAQIDPPAEPPMFPPPIDPPIVPPVDPPIAAKLLRSRKGVNAILDDDGPDGGIDPGMVINPPDVDPGMVINPPDVDPEMIIGPPDVYPNGNPVKAFKFVKVANPDGDGSDSPGGPGSSSDSDSPGPDSPSGHDVPGGPNPEEDPDIDSRRQDPLGLPKKDLISHVNLQIYVKKFKVNPKFAKNSLKS